MMRRIEINRQGAVVERRFERVALSILGRPQMRAVLKAASLASYTAEERLTGPARWKDYVRWRWAIAVVCKELCPQASNSSIARLLNRDQSTVSTGLAQCRANPSLVADKVAAIKERLA